MVAEVAAAILFVVTQDPNVWGYATLTCIPAGMIAV